ncbi:MAG: hypothetical protein F4235_02335 [Candidatus Dadabacteria bacterium]|nr:hypothetical protein [Candidatus Dadabacteria bacterium]MYI96267.1 hypothetical protein [Acidobacteriota bacterium]
MTTAFWATLVLAGIAVFSVAIKFDLNAFLENRRREQFARLKAMCPHCVLAEEGGQTVIEGLVISPPGTLQAHCTRCHRVFVGGLEEAWEATRVWRENPGALQKAEERFRRYGRRTRILVE